MAEKLYTWTQNFEIFEKNIIEDDIIFDDEIINLQNKIKTYCPSNYSSYNGVARSGYSVHTEYVETDGESDCNGCDTTVHCYPASNGKGSCEAAFENANTCDGVNYTSYNP